MHQKIKLNSTKRYVYINKNLIGNWKLAYRSISKMKGKGTSNLIGMIIFCELDILYIVHSYFFCDLNHATYLANLFLVSNHSLDIEQLSDVPPK